MGKKKQTTKQLIKRPEGARKKKKRLGRGNASGKGTTAGRGTKGQKARAGGGVRPGFEGGQMPLIRRVPKRGFKAPFKKEFYIINLDDIEKKVKKDDVLNIKNLLKYGFIKLGNSKKRMNRMIKILGDGEITKPVTVYTHKISKSAAEKIVKAGGNIFILDEKFKLSKKAAEINDKDIPKIQYQKIAESSS